MFTLLLYQVKKKKFKTSKNRKKNATSINIYFCQIHLNIPKNHLHTI